MVLHDALCCAGSNEGLVSALKEEADLAATHC